MGTQIGYIQDLSTIVTTDATCSKCGGLGYIKSFKSLPNGGICYRCDGLGSTGKDLRTTTETVETTKPLVVEFMEEGDVDLDAMMRRIKHRAAKPSPEFLAQAAQAVDANGEIDLIKLFSITV